MSDRRLVQIHVTGELIADALAHGSVLAAKVVEGLPPDAKLVHAGMCRNASDVYLVFEHPTFAPCAPGAEPTIVSIAMARLDLDGPPVGEPAAGEPTPEDLAAIAGGEG